jgi:hypothetical protein
MKNVIKNSEIPTYYDLKYSQTSKIFESEEIEGMTSEQIMEAERTYNILVEKLQKGEPIDEGILGGIIGGGIGLLAGPMIGKAICKALGIDENGSLGKLLTSRLVSTAIGLALGR